MENLKLNKKTTTKWLSDYAIFFVLLLLVAIIVAIDPRFWSLTNLRNILSQSSTRIIIALGVGGILITQGTDLSAGRQVGLAAIISASLLQAGDYAYKMYPNLPELTGIKILIPIIVIMLVGAGVGTLNGISISIFKVPAFIATLGMQIIVYGLASMYFDRPPYGAQPIGGFSQQFKNIATGALFPNVMDGKLRIPYLVIFAAIACILIWILWNKTRFGKNMYAIGGNPEAAAVSGVNVVKYTIMIYILASVLYAFAGFLEAGRVASATNNTGNMYELDAIAACVVGGVSITGGVGTVLGIITGVLIFTVINYGLTFLGVSVYLQYIIKGLIIVVAVAIDIRKYIRKN